MKQDAILLRFEEQRDRLRGLAFRLLGSASDAEDAVQEAWLRLRIGAPDEIGDLAAWLTTVVSRIALDVLRARRARREVGIGPDQLEGLPDERAGADPERATALAEAVGIAMLVVLERLPVMERTAFVLHDVFGMPYRDLAALLERSPEAARQLASRARIKVRGWRGAPIVDRDTGGELVRAFFAASRNGDHDALLALLHPDVILVLDGTPVAHGAAVVAGRACAGAGMGLSACVMSVGGSPAIVASARHRPVLVMRFDARADRITRVDIVREPRKLDAMAYALPPPS